MSEPMHESPLMRIATSVYEVIWKTSNGFLGGLEVSYRMLLKRKQINAALLEYAKGFRSRYGQVKPIDRNETFDIDLVFTDIECTENSGHLQGPDCLQSLEIKFHGMRRLNRHQLPVRRSVFEIAKTTSQLMLRGGPGAGKTTFLKKVGIEALKPINESKYNHDCIPVFIELKRLISKKIDLEKLIREQFEACEMPDEFDFTRTALETGNFLILLDGMDEIPYENIQNALPKIKFFAQKYPRNRYIATCREGANYYEFLNTFTDIYIADFTNQQIDIFVRYWFQRDSASEQDPYEKEQNLARQNTFLWMLKTAKNPAIKELARNPLLLTLLCLFYQECNSLPNNRINLFNQALDLFVNKWFATKKVQPNPILGKELDPTIEKVMLSEVAYKGLKANSFFFSNRELIESFEAYMESNPNVPNLDGQEVLKAIKILQGILVGQTSDHCSFSHVTFQEYLAAQYAHNTNIVSQLVDKHVADPRWKEVFSMISGLSTVGSDQLLQEMEEKSRFTTDQKKVRSLAAWSELIVSDKVRALEEQVLPKPTRDVKTALKHLDLQGWELVIKHAATFYILGSLLNSYAKAFAKCTELATISNDNKLSISNVLIRYSSLIISDVYEHLSSRSDHDDYGEQAVELLNLIKTIRRIGTITKSIITLEGCKHGALIFLKLKAKLQKIGFLCGEAQGTVRKNIGILEQLERLDANSDLTQKKQLVTNMWENWLVGLGLVPFEIMDMTDHDLRCLEKYLYTNSLIINCRIRAVNVSQSVWNNTLLNMMRRSA